MDQQDQSRADLDWREGAIPVSRRFDDPYFSLNGGLEETRHVFLAGNDLPARLRPGFHVAELGFGTGLNLLALAQVATMPVRFTSFEAFPMSGDELARAPLHRRAGQRRGGRGRRPDRPSRMGGAGGCVVP